MYTRWRSDYGKSSREKVVSILLRSLDFPMKYLVSDPYGIQRKLKNYLWSHGIGRHTEQELYGIAERDLLAVSELLGPKKLLFGDKPCLADAALFAFIAGCAWDIPESPIGEMAKSKVKNLEKHAQRMKAMCYPDWEEIMSKKPKSE